MNFINNTKKQMEPTLREYQVEPVRKGIEFLLSGSNRPSIIIAPTAAGKSLYCAAIMKGLDAPALVLQPSKELLSQNFEKFHAFGGKATIYSASFNSRRIGENVYATIGSIKNIGHIFKERGFKYLLVDEIDRFPRESGSMFGKFLKDSGITCVLGLTATPLKLQTNRDLYGNTFSKLVMLTSRSAKGNFFKDIIHCTQIQEMTRLGFWSKLEYELYNIDSTGLVYNSTKAEFTEASINKMYELNNTNDRIKFKLEEAKDRKHILVFVPSVAAAKRLAQEVPNSAVVYGDMPDDERDITIKNFKSGKIRVVFNFSVLGVGFDFPELDCVILGRVSASLSWFYQVLGRGTRIHPDKENCLIVDFSGMVSRFGKVEGFYYVQEGGKWKLYGENGVLLTGIPITEIGKHTHETELMEKPVIITFGTHKGKQVKDAPKSWREWAMMNITWNEYNSKIKKEIERLNKLETVNHTF
jgi:DNA repair protein RadD